MVWVRFQQPKSSVFCGRLFLFSPGFGLKIYRNNHLVGELRGFRWLTRELRAGIVDPKWGVFFGGTKSWWLDTVLVGCYIGDDLWLPNTKGL